MRQAWPAFVPLLILVASCGESAVKTEGTAHPLESDPVLVSAAALDDAGNLHLAIHGGDLVHLSLSGPVSQATQGATIDTAITPGWSLVFSAMVPAAATLPVVGEEPDKEGAYCWVAEDETGEEKEWCEVPHVGYGTYSPQMLHLDPGQPDTRILIHFHQIGLEQGATIRVDLLYATSTSDERGECRVYQAHTSKPLEFVLGENLAGPLESLPAVVGPLFPMGDQDRVLPRDSGASSDCRLSEIPLPFVQHCPQPQAVPVNGAFEGTTFWYQWCVAATSVPE